jgi:hypothetical protein
MRKLLGVLSIAVLLALGATAIRATTIPLFPQTSGCVEPSQLLSCLNQLITTINAQISNTPAWMTPRNLLDNGAMQVSQRGTGAATCALNGAAITSAAYSADRWGCEVNVAVGAGQLTQITATPTPPPGFSSAIKIVRNSGALTQAQCIYQEVPNYKVVQVQGQQVTFSIYQQALAGLAADQGSTTQTFNMLIITGTTSDQGLGTWTASPALTPAWAGVATQVNTSQPTPVTPAWARYTTTAFIPTNAAEIAVAICFTPTAAGQSATDGIAVTGAQLEQGAVATPYEFRPPGGELAELQRYLYRIAESATSATMRGSCVNLTSSISNCIVPFPVTMRVVPTMTYSTGFGIAVAAQTSMTACTANATSTTATSAASTLSVLMSCANAAAGGALGTATTWGDAGGTGVITASADF